MKIQFQTPQDLAGFRKVLKGKTLKSDINNLILTCECQKEDIAVAMNHYAGEIIEPNRTA